MASIADSSSRKGKPVAHAKPDGMKVAPDPADPSTSTTSVEPPSTAPSLTPGAVLLNKLSPKPPLGGEEKDDEKEYMFIKPETKSKPDPHRFNTLILVNNKPTAFFVETDEKKSKKKKNRNKDLDLELEDEPLPLAFQKTLRFWHPEEHRKSILVKLGKEETPKENIFALKNIRKKDFQDWRKEAKLNLPSVTGGAHVSNIDHALNMASIIQKDKPREVERTKRALSMEDEENPEAVAALRKSMRWGRSSLSPIHAARLFRSMAQAKKRSSGALGGALDIAEFSSTTAEEGSTSEAEEITEGGIRIGEIAAELAGTDLRAKLHNLRELSEHLCNKKRIRKKLIQLSEQDETTLLLQKIPLREQIIHSAERIRDLFRDIRPIWEKDINEINGRYGIVVASYFDWLRRILFITILTFMFSFFIIMLPEIVERKTYPEDPEDEKLREEKESFHFIHLFYGGGYFRDSLVYYGGYKNRNRDFRGYLFTSGAARFAVALFCIFGLNTLFVVSRIRQFYHSVRLESQTSGYSHMKYFKSIICAWEFSCDKEVAAKLLHKTIAREFAQLARFGEDTDDLELLDIISNNKKKILAFLVKRFGLTWGCRLMHLISSFFLVSCCVLVGEAMYYLCELKFRFYVECEDVRDDGKHTDLKHNFLCPGGSKRLESFIFSLPALFASVITVSLDKVIVSVAKTENFDSVEWKVCTTMIRGGIFNFTAILVYYIFWILKKDEISEAGYVPETIFGQELLRYILIEGFFDLVFNLGYKFAYQFYLKKRNKEVKKTEFQPEYCAQSMFFLYPVAVLGTMFCPPISLVVSIRLVIHYYQHRYELMHLSSQESFTSHASIVYAPYLLTFFICYLFTSFLEGFYISETSPSTLAGPFKHYSAAYDEVVLEMVTSVSYLRWLTYFRSHGFLTMLIFTLSAAVYFFRSWALAYVPIQEQLIKLIVLERGDRDVLLKAIFEIARFAQEATDADDAENVMMAKGIVSDDEDVALATNVNEEIDKLINEVRARRPIGLVEKKAPAETKVRNEKVQATIGRIVDARKRRDELRAKRKANKENEGQQPILKKIIPPSPVIPSSAKSVTSRSKKSKLLKKT